MLRERSITALEWPRQPERAPHRERIIRRNIFDGNGEAVLARATIFLLAIAGFSLSQNSVIEASDPIQTPSAERDSFGNSGSLSLEAIVSIRLQVRKNLGLLESPSYRTRRRAADWLASVGPVAMPELRHGLASENVGVRRTCQRILDSLVDRLFERQLEELLSSYDADREYSLPGWDVYRQFCGDDNQARALYVRLARRESQFMRWLQVVHEDSTYNVDREIDDVSKYLSPDVARLSSGDPLYWTMMLLASAEPKVNRIPVLGSRLRGGLQDKVVVRSLKNAVQHRTILRLIQNWLSGQAPQYASRSTMRIAMLYQFEELGKRLARQTLQFKNASPSATQTAMFLLATKSAGDASPLLESRLNDDRVCQVWQIVSTRRRAVQTQVKDTALALLLHINDIDPRTVGFRDVQADPITVFREHSLGFETESERESAYRRGVALLRLAAE